MTHATQIEQLRQLCEQHCDAKPKALRDLAREFLFDWDVIVRPLADPRLPLTNNAAERQLRHFVIARRISHGTRTEVGSHSVVLLASSIDICQLRLCHQPVRPCHPRRPHEAASSQPQPAGCSC